MSSAYAYSDKAMAEERAEMTRWLTKSDAKVVPIGGKRKPLGLRPVPDDDPAPDDDTNEDGHIILHDGFHFSFRDNVDPAFLKASAANDYVAEIGNACVSIADHVHRAAKKGIAEVRTETREQVARLELQNSEQRAIIAELRATVAELKATVGEVAFVSERLRVDKRGPPGHQGGRGVDGPPGPRGEKGERGERGDPGAMIVGWRIDADRHLCTPQYSDGSSGAPLNRSAFVDDAPEDDEE
jgi:hypothetical protein